MNLPESISVYPRDYMPKGKTGPKTIGNWTNKRLDLWYDIDTPFYPGCRYAEIVD